MRKRYEMQGADIDVLEDYKSREREKKKDSIHSISPLIAVVFLILFCILYQGVVLFEDILPNQLQVGDEISQPDRFIGERAQKDLKTLVGFGTRLVGSYENEELTVDFLQRELTFIQSLANKNQKIETDVQIVSGAYYLDFKPHGLINAYGNVQNVIVRLHGKNDSSSNSILVNAHFDSAFTSPGASDDGINCVTMLEIIRILTRSSERLDHDVIFLFNGAEETAMQASHGFISQHPWAKNVAVFINLEAAGSGGKESLFQTGPSRPWLLTYYHMVPHPMGQSFGEEIFQNGIIPSDTDFRIFRDFGKKVGLDFALTRDGYRYHTKYDDFSYIQPGSYQRLGDNMLTLVKNIANAPELNDLDGQVKGDLIYYDIFNWFIISYSKTVAVIVYSVVSVISLCITVKSFYDFGLMSSWYSMLYIIFNIGVLLLGWILGIIVVFIIAYILDAIKFSMSWFNNTWLIFGLYVIPITFTSIGPIIIFNKYYQKNNLSISGHVQIQLHLMRFLTTIFLIVGLSYELRSIYILFMPLLFHTLAFIPIHVFKLQHSVNTWLIIYIIFAIFPTLFNMRQAFLLLQVIVPICGRAGITSNPEITIGILTLFLTLLIISPYVPLISLIRKPVVIFLSFIIVFIISFTIIFTPIAFPYNADESAPTPQRISIIHTSRTVRNDTNNVIKRDSGIYLMPWDRNGPSTIKTYLKSENSLRKFEDDCDKYLMCGIPAENIRAIPSMRNYFWIPSVQPIIHEPVELQLNNKTVLPNSIVRFNVTASGPTHMFIYIHPKRNVILETISLLPDAPSPSVFLDDRPVYIIWYNWGKEKRSLDFTLDLKVSNSWKGEALVDIAVVGRYVHDRNNIKTPQFMNILNKFPEWTNVIQLLASYESWVY